MRHRMLALAVPGLFLPSLAFATNGYISHGIGVRSQGTAGVGYALVQDAFAAAANPAAAASSGDRIDLGLSLFRPTRGSRISGNQAGADGEFSGNGEKNFLIPEFAYSHQVSPQIGVGLAVYGNGGMNTDYRSNPFGAFGSSGNAGVDLSQLFVSPSIAYRLAERHAFGVALNLAYQRFSAEGLGAFDNPFTSSRPGSVTNRGTDSATGWGVKLGYLGEITPELSVGVSWASEVDAGRFDRYAGLFAEQGGFDTPSQYGFGFAWKASPALTLAADWQRIEYSDIKSVGNPLENLFAGNLLGTDDGGGFGWQDVSVIKLGIVYRHDERLTLRGGYSRSDQPIPASQTFFNILAPGVVRDHWSLGASWKLEGGGEWSFSYTRAARETVRGRNAIPAAFGGGEADIHLEEDIFGIAYSWTL